MRLGALGLRTVISCYDFKRSSVSSILTSFKCVNVFCFRWMHAVCQNLNTEEEVENVADIGFDCSMCRPYMPVSNGKIVT